MSILDNDRLRSVLPNNVVVPYDPTRVKDASYELSLGNEYFTTDLPDGIKVIIEPGNQVVIKPGQFALLITKETVTIPDNVLAFISIKASIKFRGLVNVSGFHVDPGFTGKLKFAVYNAGSKDIVLDWEQRLFPMWLCKLTSPNEKYDGIHNHQASISSDDVSRINGEILSPSVLSKKIDDLANTRIKELEKLVGVVQTQKSIILTIVGSILLLALGILANTFFNSPNFGIWQKQTAFESNINGISIRSEKQDEVIKDLEKRVNEVERKTGSSATNTNTKTALGK